MFLQRFFKPNFSQNYGKNGLDLLAVRVERRWCSRSTIKTCRLLLLSSPVPEIPSLLQNRASFGSSCIRNYGIRIPKKETKGKKKGKGTMALTKEEMDQIVEVDEIHEKMSKVVEKLKHDYIKHLGVRTAFGAIDTLEVELEGGNHPLNEIAQVARKGPHLVVINAGAMPQAVPSIVKSIEGSGMNLNPQQEGNTIYVSLPAVTREHREQLSKSAKSFFLKSKDAIRAIQQQFSKQAAKHKVTFSEDLVFNVQQQIIAVADDYIAQAEKLMLVKQEELLGTQKSQ